VICLFYIQKWLISGLLTAMVKLEKVFASGICRFYIDFSRCWCIGGFQ
jgi:hypothetical protein